MTVETAAKEKGQVEHSESSDSRPTGCSMPNNLHTL